MPVPSLTAWPSLAVRFVIAACAFTLLATAVATSAPPAAGADLSSAISSSRRSQQYYQSLMLQADRRLAPLDRSLKASRKNFKNAKRIYKRSSRAHRVAIRIVKVRRARVQEVESAYASPDDAPKPWRYKARLQKVRQSLRIAIARKRYLGSRVRSFRRARAASYARIISIKRQRAAYVRQREGAEAGLAGHIVRSTQLASARAQSQSTVQLAAGNGTFSWPAVGRISQTYGCTGFYINPSRGSCRHFHDGLDIVAGYGSPVRAAAVGVVAYVGWNPWDKRGRAYIVVVAHPDGFVTRYGHLMARKRVRVGQVVHTGQAIGKMGNTGYSTGTHLHFELLRNGQDVNPLTYLPKGVVKIKVDKKSTKKGTAKAKRKARARARAAERRQAKRERRQQRRAAARAARQDAPLVTCTVDLDTTAPPPAFDTSARIVDDRAIAAAVEADAVPVTTASALCEPVPIEPAAHSPTDGRPPPDVPTRTRSAVDDGVVMPPRGTSPIPQ